MKMIYSTSYPRALKAVSLGAAFHVGAWLIATQTQCHSIGLGATECDGGFGVFGAIVALALGFLGTPLLVAFLLRRAGQKRARSVAWGAQLIAIPITVLLFQPLFRADIHSAPLYWELVTQLVAVPIISLILASRLQPPPSSADTSS